MTDFVRYTEPSTPTRIPRIDMRIFSELGKDDEGNWETVPTERMVATAVVIDQDDRQLSKPSTGHQALLNLDLLTPAQVSGLQNLIQQFRADVEAFLLPTPG